MKTYDHRITGVLYLFVIILAGFSQGNVRGTLIVPGDGAISVANILKNETLFRIGIVTDMTAFILDVIISVMLYQMFKDQSKTLAMVSSALRLLAHPAIGSLNLLNHYLAYRVVTGDGIRNIFDVEQIEAICLFFMEAHQYGYLIAGGLFGLHCICLGVLIYRSEKFPGILGSLLIASGIGYLIETYGNFILPGYEYYTAIIVGVSAAIGEVSFTFFLLVKGRKKILPSRDGYD